MSTRAWFPTLVYESELARDAGARPDAERLRQELLTECRQLREVDEEGRRWCAENYPDGFTTYASLNQLHRMSPVFAELAEHLSVHVEAYARELDYDVDDHPLALTDCWANVMPRHSSHALHLHPNSTVSGTYYVSTPDGASDIVFEDPRLALRMAAPPRVAKPRPANRSVVSYPVQEGHVVLFESWLRHRVPPSRVDADRVSISFNFHWA